MAGDGAAAGGERAATELASFYPKRYGEPFMVEGEGVRGSWVTTGSHAAPHATLHTATHAALRTDRCWVSGRQYSDVDYDVPVAERGTV